MNADRIPFSQQFCQCKEENMTGKGDFLKFREHPHLMPLFPLKAVKAVQKALKKNPDEGIQLLSCLRFGGVCHSGNADCQKLRAKKFNANKN